MENAALKAKMSETSASTENDLREGTVTSLINCFIILSVKKIEPNIAINIYRLIL